MNLPVKTPLESAGCGAVETQGRALQTHEQTISFLIGINTTLPIQTIVTNNGESFLRQGALGYYFYDDADVPAYILLIAPLGTNDTTDKRSAQSYYCCVDVLGSRWNLVPNRITGAFDNFYEPTYSDAFNSLDRNGFPNLNDMWRLAEARPDFPMGGYAGFCVFPTTSQATSFLIDVTFSPVAREGATQKRGATITIGPYVTGGLITVHNPPITSGVNIGKLPVAKSVSAIQSREVRGNFALYDCQPNEVLIFWLTSKVGDLPTVPFNPPDFGLLVFGDGKPV